MKKVILAALVAAPFALFSQLSISTNNSASTLAQMIAGNGVTISNASLNCGSNAAGTFNYTGSNLGMTGGILLTTGHAADASGSGSSFASTDNGNNFSDANLVAIEPLATNDVCILQFDFIPICSSINITFVFGSEEYPEFVNSGYNDAFGIFLTGPGYSSTNIATLPNGVTVSIDHVNSSSNSTYYHNNSSNPNGDIAYDGYTIPITSTKTVSACSTYHMKIGIADAGDGIYDSGVFIGSNAVSCTNAPAVTTSATPATCGNSNGSVTSTVTNYNGTVTYQWLPGNQTTPTVTNLAAGTYTCLVSYDAGCSATTTQTVTATITNPGSATLSVSSTSATCSYSSNGSATVTATGGTAPITYTWNTTPAQNTAVASNLHSGTYQVAVGDGNGCVLTTTVDVGYQYPSSLQAQTQYTCGTQMTFTAPSGTSYQWYNPSNSPIGGATGLTYNATGVSNGQYYTVGYTDNTTGCRDSVRFNIQLTNLNFTPVASSPCNGGNNGSLSFSAGSGNTYPSFNWNMSGTSTGSASNVSAPISINSLGGGTYSVTISVSGNSTCAYTYTGTLVPDQLGAPTIDTVRACNLDTVHLNPNVSGSTYNWYTASGTFISTITGTSLDLYPLPFSGLNVNTAGATYVDTIVSAFGCKSVYKAVIKTMSLEANITALGQLKCHNDSTGKIKLTITRENNGPIGLPYTFNWIYPSPYTSPATVNANPPVPVSTTESNLHPGWYYVITKTGNCVRKDSLELKNPAALPLDTLNAYYCPKDSLALIVAAPNHTPYHWLNNNVLVTASQNTNYNNDSIQVVTADISNYTVYYLKNGCRDSAKTRIDHPVYNPFRPDVTVNIFTPNHDGINDLFYPFHDPKYTQRQIDKQMELYELHVYDRWGIEVCQTNEYSKPWDGKNQSGTDLPDGTYYWIAKYKSNCSSKADVVEKKGFVQLIR